MAVAAREVEVRAVEARAAAAKAAVRAGVEMAAGVRVTVAMEEVMGAVERAAVAKAAAKVAVARAAALVVAGAVRNREEMAGMTVGWAFRVAVVEAAAGEAVAARVVAVMAAEVKAMVVRAASAAGREKGTSEVVVEMEAAAKGAEAAAKGAKAARTVCYRSTRRNGTPTRWRREGLSPSTSAPRSSSTNT